MGPHYSQNTANSSHSILYLVYAFTFTLNKIFVVYLKTVDENHVNKIFVVDLKIVDEYHVFLMVHTFHGQY